jgi:hypothetical protein
MIFRTLEPPEWLEDGANFGEEGVHLGLDRCMIKICKLRCRAFGVLRALKTASSVEKVAYLAELQNVVEEAQEVDSALSDWCASLPQDWLYSVQPASTKMLAEFPPTPENPYYPKTTHIYNNIAMSVQWNRYRGFRLIANGLIFKALTWQGSITGTDPAGGALLKARASSNFQVLTDDICASIAYFFALTDSGQENEKVHNQAVDMARIGKLSWILTVSVATPEMPDNQRDWVKHLLTVVGEISGFPVLQEFAKVCSPRASLSHPST